MSAPAWEDLGAFFETDADGGFAIAALVTFANATTRTITGIFDDPYLEASLRTYDMDSNNPKFCCKESDTAGIVRGCTLTVGSTVYDILTGPQSDGTGLAILQLARQAV